MKPSWRVFATHENIKQLRSSLNNFIRLHYLHSNYPKIKSIISFLNECLFSKVTSNPHHVLHQILPPVKSTTMRCWDKRTIYKNKHSLFTIAKHSSLVFSLFNKLIILDVRRFWFEWFFLLFFYFFFHRSFSVQCGISWLITFSAPEFYFFFLYLFVSHILYHYQRQFKLI